MASIISKKVNGQTYYYLRQMARVDGKPKMAWERYLGKAEDIEAAVAGSTAVPERTQTPRFRGPRSYLVGDQTSSYRRDRR